MKEYPEVKPVDIAADLAVHGSKTYTLRKLSAIKRIVVHTTDWDTSPQRLAKYDIGPNHISKTGCPAITYHEIVMKDGVVYKTLPYEQVSWHVGPWNGSSLGVALMFRVSDDKGKDSYAPDLNQLKALQTRLGQLCMDLGLTPDCVVGHRELKGTGWFMFKGSRRLRKTCPGLQVDLDQLRTNVALYMQIMLKTLGWELELDGVFGPKSRAAFAAYLRRR